ncbi:hypothetical protein J6590_008507 [Homalodisca vitripennis]|nr:hypothetical protein J6590_008507 [Homalodisca vitripennis]
MSLISSSVRQVLGKQSVFESSLSTKRSAEVVNSSCIAEIEVLIGGSCPHFKQARSRPLYEYCTVPSSLLGQFMLCLVYTVQHTTCTAQHRSTFTWPTQQDCVRCACITTPGQFIYNTTHLPLAAIKVKNDSGSRPVQRAPRRPVITSDTPTSDITISLLLI